MAAAGSMAADGRTAPGGGRALRARGCGIREEGEGSGEGYGGAAGTKFCAERERDVTWPLPRGKAGAAGRHFVAGWCCMWGDMAMCRSRRQSSPHPAPSTLENSAAPHICLSICITVFIAFLWVLALTSFRCCGTQIAPSTRSVRRLPCHLAAPGLLQHRARLHIWCALLGSCLLAAKTRAWFFCKNTELVSKWSHREPH